MSARSRIATRRAAAELAGHRRRLLECSAERELDPADALLLRIDPQGHRAGLARLAEAALAVGEDSHLTQLKAAATDSRPPRGTDLRLTAAPTSLQPGAGTAGQLASQQRLSRWGEGEISTPTKES